MEIRIYIDAIIILIFWSSPRRLATEFRCCLLLSRWQGESVAKVAAISGHVVFSPWYDCHAALLVVTAKVSSFDNLFRCANPPILFLFWIICCYRLISGIIIRHLLHMSLFPHLLWIYRYLVYISRSLTWRTSLSYLPTHFIHPTITDAIIFEAWI